MFSKSCQYAIRAVLYLAVNAGPERKLGVRELADGLDAPKHFLAKILQLLVRRGLISSTKGPSGGFFLSEKNRKVTLRSVVEAVDGPDIFTGCILGLPACSSDHPCPLHDQMLTYRNGLMEIIEHQTIDQVAEHVAIDQLKL